MEFKNLFILGIVFLFLFGCVNLEIDGFDEVNGETDKVDDSSNIDPKFSIIHPAANAQIKTISSDADVELIFSTKDILLVEPNDENKIGEGHFVVSFAGLDFNVTESSYVLSNIPLGEYQITVEFVNNNGSSYEEPIIRTVQFSVVVDEELSPKSKDYLVKLVNGGFDSTNLNAKVGDTITVSNSDEIAHTFNLQLVGGYSQSSTALKQNEKFTFTLERSGVYELSSITIPTISGTINVE